MTLREIEREKKGPGFEVMSLSWTSEKPDKSQPKPLLSSRLSSNHLSPLVPLRLVGL
jgi:hypothetical protein